MTIPYYTIKAVASYEEDKIYCIYIEIAERTLSRSSHAWKMDMCTLSLDFGI
jgi:hypothetical protein